MGVVVDAVSAVLPDEVAAWVAYAPVEALLRPPLVGVDVESLSRDGKLDLAVGLERLAGYVAAVQARTLASLAAEPEELPGSEFVIEEIAAALRWSPSTAAARVHQAQLLADRLPGTLGLLGAGEISPTHARAVTDTVLRTGLDAARAAVVEARVLPRAGQRTAVELRRDLRRAVAAVDPRDAAAKHRDAVAERRVAYQPDEHGMAWLSAYLSAPDAHTVWLAVQAVAEHNQQPGDDRNADQRRADALTALCAAVLTGDRTGQSEAGLPALPEWQGRRPSIQVTVALSTLLGDDEQPAELDGYGPIPAVLARRIAADPTGTWRRLVTDQRGQLVDYGRTRYRPPQDLTDHVIARDRVCRHPGCHRDARRAELDHITAWAHGGDTSATNIHVLCKRHHKTKHDAGWRVHRHPDGATNWTSPTGRRYTKPSATLPLDCIRPRSETTRRSDPRRVPRDLDAEPGS
jgi:hypothetical protein